jgi:hypothetical protein
MSGCSKEKTLSADEIYYRKVEIYKLAICGSLDAELEVISKSDNYFSLNGYPKDEFENFKRIEAIAKYLAQTKAQVVPERLSLPYENSKSFSEMVYQNPDNLPCQGSVSEFRVLLKTHL